jgi:chromate transporter
VGYAVRGVPGAVVGWLALATPAFVAIPLLVALRRWLHVSRVRNAVDAVIIGGATLLVPSGLLLAREALMQLWSS